ncbi:MAG: ribonuclease/clavin/mitogillin, partial [Gammaproteobacteria bacterium]
MMRISTAVLLTRGVGTALEVYLVRRSEQLRFFGGYWACPGGVVDRADVDGEPESDGTHRRCGLRELFEETGVLPSAWAASLPEAERHALREGLLVHHAAPDDASAAAFQQLIASDPSALQGARPFARLTTPAFAPVRYKTCFIQVDLPSGQVPDVWPGELTEGEFASPDRWLERWRAGALPIAPPVVFLLEMLAGTPLDEFFERAGQRCRESEEGRLHPICNTPGILTAPLPTVTLPPATTTNSYIVGEERLFVVDPATREPAAQESLFELLDRRLERERTDSALAGVLVTHHHADHVGAVEAVARRFDCPVYAHPLTLERLPHTPQDARPLEDGDELWLGRAPDGSAGWVLRVYHTPGHDRGHLVFMDSRYGAALAGDLASTVSSIIIDPPEG